MRIVLTGGGTGGHVYPALAVYERLLEKEPSVQVLYVGHALGLERDIVANAKLPFSAVRSRGVAGRGVVGKVVSLAHVGRGVVQARSILRQFQPDVVLATGGYVCVPVAMASKMLNIPVLVHEQNVIAGSAVRFISRFARRVLVSFSDTRVNGDVCVTGNPVRPDVISVSREQGCAELGWDPDVKSVVMVGGSRGAQTLALVATDMVKLAVRNGCQLLVSTGNEYYDQVMDDINAEGIAGDVGGKIMIKPYVHEMAHALAAADIVVARAGATTVAEITARGLCSVLVPSPNVVNDHQMKNAHALAERRAAVVVSEMEVKQGRLIEQIELLLSDDDRRALIADNAGKIGCPDAADKIATEILKCVGK